MFVYIEGRNIFTQQINVDALFWLGRTKRETQQNLLIVGFRASNATCYIL
ncbi:MAG: hypothetical protein KME09_09035 [Pleurocapsa minor HA4230-MV1]|nr:hypothetical protein [Pleurocapsa minor HA4230-MV1]